MGQTNLIGSKICKFRITFRILSSRYSYLGNPSYCSFKTGVPFTNINNVRYLLVDSSNFIKVNGSVLASSIYTYFDIEINDGSVVNFNVVEPLTFSNVSDLNPSDYSQFSRVSLNCYGQLRDFENNAVTLNNEIFKYIGNDCCFRVGENLVLNLLGGKTFGDSVNLDSNNLPRLLLGGQEIFSLSFDNNFNLESVDFVNNFNSITVGESFVFNNLVNLPFSNFPSSEYPSEIQCLNNIDNSLKQLTNEVIEVGKAVSSFNVDIDVINNDKEKSLVNTVFPYKNFKS